MDQRDAQNREMLESEYELLYCVRDLIKLYERQQRAMYGRTSNHIKDTLDDTERRLQEIERQMDW